MASTRAELRADVRTELKKDPNGKIWNDPTLDRYIDKAYLKVQKDGNFQWRENQANTTFSTVIGTQEYALATDLGKIQLVRFNWSVVYKTTLVQLKKEQSTFVNGQPSRYYLNWNNIGFDVISNIVGTVDFDYVKRLARFTADTDESAFWEDFDAAIVKYAAFLAWSAMDWKQQTAAVKEREYTLEIETLISSYLFDDTADLTYFLQKGTRGVTNSQTLDRGNRRY